MRARVDRAVELVREGPTSSLVCCGTKEEIEVMRALLEQRGLSIDPTLDCRASSTRGAMKALSCMPSLRGGPVVAVSSPYHLHRIKVEGRRNGLGVVCVPSRISPGAGGRVSVRGMASLARLHFRELIASWWYAISSPGQAGDRRGSQAR
jgi:hypothetical protein